MTKYSSWLNYFEYNNWSLNQFPFAERPSLSSQERNLVARSLQQFQLGEGSSGEGLLRRTRSFAAAHGHFDLPETMERFIREEQRHSAVLGRFLDQEGIPRIERHWSDGAFRRIRNLAGLELMLIVLSTAEYIAVPYYQALHDATESHLLRCICKRILLDEAQHVEFQAMNLDRCATGRGEAGRALTIALQLFFLTAACALVYPLHAKVFRAAAMSPLRFLAIAVNAYGPVFQRMTSNRRVSEARLGALLS